MVGKSEEVQVYLYLNPCPSFSEHKDMTEVSIVDSTQDLNIEVMTSILGCTGTNNRNGLSDLKFCIDVDAYRKYM